MTPVLTPAEFVARLTAVDWSSAEGLRRSASRTALMREHLRRASLWADELACEEWPFPDLAAGIDPHVQPAPELEEQVIALVAVSGPVTRDVALKALRWYTVQQSDARRLVLPDPYEPLIWFLERGGDFTLISGWIDLYGGIVPRGSIDTYKALDQQAALDAATLDGLDGPAAN